MTIVHVAGVSLYNHRILKHYKIIGDGTSRDAQSHLLRRQEQGDLPRIICQHLSSGS